MRVFDMAKQELTAAAQKEVAEPEVAEPEVPQSEVIVKRSPQDKTKNKPKKQPKYNVILWNDDDHTYEYVVRMMKVLFGHAEPRGFEIAYQVDKTGRAICLTTTMEHAELKRDQIHAFGRDQAIPRSKGAMSASIEAVE
jgi:ATP-dependent Clp protease adaptor protein ClpS